MLFAVSIFTFIVFYVMPGADPVLLRAGRQPTPELIALIKQNLGLDRSLPYQFVHYMNRLIFHFDLGRSFFNNVDVRTEIFGRFPVTAMLAISATIVWLAIGIPIGIASAVRPRSLLDRGSMGFALFAVSAPDYWLGLVLLFTLSQDGHFLRIFPGQGACIDFSVVGCAPSMVLPSFVLGVTSAAFYARITRSSMLESLSQDYVRTARAKGLPERTVLTRHAMRGAITPIVSMLGLDFAFLLGGTVLVETVFNIPGLGRLIISAILRRDYPVVQGVVLLTAAAYMLINLMVDVVYAHIDPRIRYA